MGWESTMGLVQSIATVTLSWPWTIDKLLPEISRPPLEVWQGAMPFECLHLSRAEQTDCLLAVLYRIRPRRICCRSAVLGHAAVFHRHVVLWGHPSSPLPAASPGIPHGRGNTKKKSPPRQGLDN